MSLHQRGRGWPLLLAGLLLAVLMPAPARGEPAGKRDVDLILLLDRSGSMLINDPQDLTRTGAELFLGMLDPGDRVAVIAFDTDARTVVPLSAVGGGEAARKQVAAMGRPVGQWTHINAVLDAALAVLSGREGRDRPSAVLLFTDGRPEIGPEGVPPGYLEEMEQRVAALAARGVPVFGIGLGQADVELLNRISNGTRAESFAASSAPQVVRLFADVLGRIKERQMALTFEEELAPGAAGQIHTIEVPPYTRLLTLSAVGGSGQVRIKGATPSGAPLSHAPGLRQATGANYQVYTISNPAAGTWQVQLEGAGRLLGMGQTESAIRLSLTRPLPFSQIERVRPSEFTVAVEGDPGPGTPLALFAQDRGGAAVQLERDDARPAFRGELPVTDGRLVVWATWGGSEVARREFRVYPVGGPSPAEGGPVEEGEPLADPLWLKAALTLAALAAALLSLGAWRWGRIRRREEQLSGRLGSLSLRGCGREAGVAAGPVIAKAGALARLEARLVPPLWVPLAGLGFGARRVRLYIHPAPGARLQINGRPPGDGRLYHGDEILLGTERWILQNPQLGRRPAARAEPVRPVRQRPPTRPTLNR